MADAWNQGWQQGWQQPSQPAQQGWQQPALMQPNNALRQTHDALQASMQQSLQPQAQQGWQQQNTAVPQHIVQPQITNTRRGMVRPGSSSVFPKSPAMGQTQPQQVAPQEAFGMLNQAFLDGFNSVRGRRR